MKEDLANYDASDPKNFDIPDDVEEDALLVHVYLGAAQKEVTFGDLRAMCKDDVAMSSITATKVLSFLKNRAPDDCHPAAGSSDKVALLDKVSPESVPYAHTYINSIITQITEYRYLKANFSSTVDWRTMTDHLRRNPSFHGDIREDFVVLRGENDSIIFAKLLFVFECSLNNGKGPFSLALVQMYDKRIPHANIPASDRYLDMIRVRPQSPKNAQLVFIDSIIRGAMLVSTNDNKDGDCFVVDSVDTDMFLRLKDWTPTLWTLY